jgi:hypothetical protein
VDISDPPLAGTPRQTAIDTLAAQLQMDWPAIVAARALTSDIRRQLQHQLEESIPPDTSVVVSGSLGRGELTSGSDLDWSLLVDGQADPQHMDALGAIRRGIKSCWGKKHGAENTFGQLAFSHDLIHRIGGERDGNRNTTLRMLLLLESTTVGPDEAYNRVVNNILRRYIEEDFGWMNARNPMNVPRFLHNDIARFWRILAVDFAYKRRERAGRGWALRTAKLRLSRKLTYAAGLVMCYSCATTEHIRAIRPGSSDPAAALKIVNHLTEYVAKTPLQILAELFLANPQLNAAAKQLFASYEEFLKLIGDDTQREALEELRHDEIASSEVYQRVRALGKTFQKSLDSIFFDRELMPQYFELTKTYGVF